MSRAERQLDLENATNTVDGRDQPSKSERDYGDSSWPLYSMYSKIAQQDDNRLVDRCQRDTNGTMVFTGLFAATVGTLLTLSIQDLKPNFQRATVFYLENIYQVLGNPNTSNISTSNPLATPLPPAFSPPKHAIWVNSLWFLSLLISLTGAAFVSLVQHWVYRYITVTQQPWHTPDQRARIRAFFASRPWGPYVTWGSDRSPLYLHLSLFLFMAGCGIYLFNLNLAVFYAVACWITIFTTAYIIVTVGGIFVPHELLYTPFSPLLLHAFLGISYVILQVCSYIRPLDTLFNGARMRYRRLSDRYSDGFIPGISKVAEETASNPSSEIDTSVIERILPALDDDHALEAFFITIPGFYIRHLFEALHQGTSAAHNTPITIFVDILDPTLGQPSSYPLCNDAIHTDLSARPQAPVPLIPRLQTRTAQLGNPPSLSPRSTPRENERISATSIDIAISTMQGDVSINPKANLIHQVLHQTKDKTPVPPTIQVVSESPPPSPSPSPAIPVSLLRSSGIIPFDARSSIEFTVIQSDSSHHRRVSLAGRSQHHSSSTKKTYSRTSCQATSASDAYVTESIGAVNAHDDASRDLNAPPYTLQFSHPLNQSTSSSPGILTRTSRLEDRQHGLDKL
ncbi:hypothetical protein V8E52_000028 [Russula decolorans]